MKKHSVRNLALGGAAALSAFGVLGGTLVHAQTSQSTPGSSSSSTQQAPAQQTPPDQSAYLDALAKNLGVTTDALKAALQKTASDQIAAALASGKITADQAAQMQQRLAQEVAAGHYPLGFGGPGGPRGGGPGGPGGPGMRQDPTALAGFLGITTDQLRTERQGGASLATIATNHGKTRDALKAFLTQQEQTNLAKAVTDGKLTQAQADDHLKQFTANLDSMIDRTGGPGGPGGRGPAPTGTPGTN
jgi:hypothetical protein